MIETIKDFLPDEEFGYFAMEAMQFPHYAPCDFESDRNEADGSIDTYGEHLRTVDVYKHQLMFQALIFSRKNLSCLATDFFVKQSRIINVIADLLDVKKWWVIRVNCTVGEDKPYVGTFHTDFGEPYLLENTKTAILYLNTNNGGTQFDDKDGPIIKSKANTLVKFPCNTPHAGIHCTDAKLRYVMNLNYE